MVTAALAAPVGPAFAQADADDGLTLVVVLASSLPDVGSAASLVAAGVGDAVLMAESSVSLGVAAASLVQERRPTRFVLVGGTAALAVSIEREVAELEPGSGTERIAGVDRLETAALAARRVGSEASTVVLANGWSLADVGVAASVVASGGADVVLYTAGDGLGAATSRALAELSARSVVAVGGTTALPVAVLDAAVAASGATSLRRLGGATRIDTAAAGAKFAAGDCVAVAVVAHGWSDADVGIAAALGAALAGSVVLYAQAPDMLGVTTEAAVERLEPARFVTVGSDQSLTAGLRTAMSEMAPLRHFTSSVQATRHALDYASRYECEEEDSGGSSSGGSSGSGSSGGGGGSSSGGGGGGGASAPDRSADSTESSHRVPIENDPANLVDADDVGRIVFTSHGDGAALVAVSTDGGEMRRLTYGASAVRNPSWSPDGTSAVYERHEGGNWQIYAADADGNNAVKLTSSAHDDILPVWSPDGSGILYFGGTGTTQLRVMGADGTGDRLVADNVQHYKQRTAEWSPDGTRIAYTGSNDSAEETLFIVNADGTGRQELDSLLYEWAGNVSWSPDGQRLAYEGSKMIGGTQIIVLNLTDDTHTTLTTVNTNSQPVWSPDGMSIAYLHYDNDRWAHVYVRDADGTNARQVTNERVVAGEPERSVKALKWSPDGSQVAYRASVERRFGDIFVIDADGTDRVQLTHDARQKTGLSWSADGSELLFAVNPGSDIYVINEDGTGKIRLTDYFGDDTHPTWSPDGTKIVYVTGDGDTEIALMNADGTNPAQLTDNDADDTHPTWSPDGTKIVYVTDDGGDGDTEIALMNADGANPAQLTDNDADDTHPKWSPDGTKIVYVTDDGDTEIALMNADGANPTQLTDNDFPDWDPDWSPDVSKIAYASVPEPGDVEIFIMNADGSGIQQLTEGGAHSSRPRWSPDGSRILYTERLLWYQSWKVLSIDGTDESRVEFGTGPIWSPDGTRVVYTGTTSVHASAFLGLVDLDNDEGNIVLAWAGSQPDWSSAASP